MKPRWRLVPPTFRAPLAVRALGLSLALALTLAACDGEPPPPSPEVVAEIAGDEVRYGEFKRYLEAALGGPGDSLGSDVLSQLLDQFLEERLLALLAADRGLLPEDVVEPRPGGTGRHLRRAAVDALLADAEAAEGAVTAAEVERWYRDHTDRFERPPRVRLRQILTEDRETAEGALAEILAGTDFGTVVQRLAEAASDGDPGAVAPAVAPSVVPSGVVGGSLGELSRDDLPPAFADVILELEPGEVSRVVEAEYGFHLFQVTEKLPAETVPLAEAREEVEREVRRERADRLLAALVEEARQRYDVAVWERNLPFNYRGIYRADAA